MANPAQLKEQLYIDLVEKIITKYPITITIAGIIFFILVSYMIIVILLFIIGFFKGYKVSLFPPSFDPTSAVGDKLEEKIDKITEDLLFIKDKLQSNTNCNVKISELLRMVNFKIDHIERQAILPNYRIPDISSLITIDDIINQIEGKVVLLKLDLDIPYKGISGDIETHMKFERSILTIEKLLDKNIKIILLIGQGIASVEQFESDIKELTLREHASILKKMINRDVDIIALSKIPASKQDINIYNKKEIIILPNLAKISPEDVDVLKNQEMNLSDNEIVNSNLILNTNNIYDVFILDDFRSTIKALPSNVGLSRNKIVSIGKGLEQDITGLNKLIHECIKFGKKSYGKRVCICGSSRPCDIMIIEAVLNHNLFDTILLGPIASIVLKISENIKINNTIRDKLAILSKKNNYDLDYLTEKVGESILSKYAEKIIFPYDFYIDDGDSPSVINFENFLCQEKFVESIGPATLVNYINEIKNSSLVFHFGMLGHSREPYVKLTEKIISTYAENNCVAIMAGDHISGLARKIGMEKKINFIIRGAKTTSFYLTNQSLPGLDPFVKIV